MQMDVEFGMSIMSLKISYMRETINYPNDKENIIILLFTEQKLVVL